MHRTPIEHVSLSEALTRVAYQLVVADYHRSPHLYRRDPSITVLYLAEQVQQAGFVALAWVLHDAASHLASGITLAEWRDRIRPRRQAATLHRLTAKRPRR